MPGRALCHCDDAPVSTQPAVSELIDTNSKPVAERMREPLREVRLAEARLAEQQHRRELDRLVAGDGERQELAQVVDDAPKLGDASYRSSTAAAVDGLMM